MSLLEPVLPSASLTALTEAAAAISSTLDLDTVLATVARLACSVTRAEAGGVFTLDAAHGRLVVSAAAGPWRDAMTGRSFDAHLGIAGHVIRTAEPVFLPNARASSRFSKEIDEAGSTRTTALLAAPMIHRAETVGLIEVVNRRDGTSFADADLKLLQIFATFAAGATQNARAHAELRQRFAGLRDSVMKRTALIGKSAPWRAALDLCDRVAKSNATVLLLGETGTGKEQVARYIHNCSRRSDEAFVAVNCAALPENLLESELFGHEKGAFTGAGGQRLGWFEVASGGTLFLDEIGEVSRAMQAKLLRVLQEKRIVRVGGTEPVACDTRIIAATNRNLKNMIIDGVFREDLYYRLSVFPIQLPALRERREDVRLLVDHFVARAAREFHIPELSVSPATLQVLEQYDWPGNVRELQNVVERSVLMSDGPILLASHLPADIQASANSDDTARPESTLWGQERQLILATLEKHDWNQSKVARELGVTRYHIRHRIKKYHLVRPPRRSGGPQASTPTDLSV